MDKLEHYRNLIENVLRNYAAIPYAYGDIQKELIFDRSNDHYQVLSIGWQQDRRVHDTPVHFDIQDGKIWLQHNMTNRNFIDELLEAGVPKDDIVLGFQPPQVRHLTGFAVK